MSYWFSDSVPEVATLKSRTRQHVPSHNPCDWTNPIVPKARPLPAGYVMPGERLRRIAAALDAEFDEKEQLKVVGGVQQSAEWHEKSAQKVRRNINKRADKMSAKPPTPLVHSAAPPPIAHRL